MPLKKKKKKRKAENVLFWRLVECKRQLFMAYPEAQTELNYASD